ncbi:MAG: ABC transporter substrate-binding protein [Candidatus Sumerlaeia bacterium]|nr:ABC transporter substrate-binding protein [Candidatus Sumerlaeia bacterium]
MKQEQKRVLAAAGAAAAVLLAAHAPAAETRTAPVSKEPIVLSIEADAQKLDPPAPTDGPSFLLIEHLYDRLVEFSDTDTTVVPGLAERWETSEDGLRWTFHLRKGVTFSDGSPMNAEAVKYTFDRVTDDTHPEHFPGLSWGSGYLLGDWYERMEILDDHTVLFVLNRPYVPLLQSLAIPPASIVSPAHTKATGEAVVGNPLGTGPYTLAEWKRGAYLKLSARKDYWGGHPANETLFFQVQPDPSQALSALRTGDAHLVTTVKPQAIGDKRRYRDAEFIEVPVFSLGYVLINTKKPHLADVRVRQAMNYAVDRENIASVLMEGTSIAAKGITPPGMLGYSETPEFMYTHDVEKARALMREAGYSEEKKLKVKFHCFEEVRPYNTVGRRKAERIASMLGEAYFDVELVQIDFRGFIEFIDQRTEHELGTIGWSSDTGDPDNFLYYLFGNPTNRSNFDHPEARELMEKAVSEMDTEKRAEMYRRAERLVLEGAPCIAVNHPKWVKGASTRLKGYKPHPVAGDRMFDAYLE